MSNMIALPLTTSSSNDTVTRQCTHISRSSHTKNLIVTWIARLYLQTHCVVLNRGQEQPLVLVSTCTRTHSRGHRIQGLFYWCPPINRGRDRSLYNHPSRTEIFVRLKTIKLSFDDWRSVIASQWCLSPAANRSAIVEGDPTYIGQTKINILVLAVIQVLGGSIRVDLSYGRKAISIDGVFDDDLGILWKRQQCSHLILLKKLTVEI